jgi:hypothetical protein
MRWRTVLAKRRTAPASPPTPTIAAATAANGLGVRTATPINITVTKHQTALAARNRSKG